MRWRLGRDRSACTTCGAELAPDAAWCGSCGAAVAAARSPDEAHPVDPPELPDDTVADAGAAPRLRRVVRVVALVALLAVVVAVLRPTPPPEPLLGRVGALAGLSATGPPPDGLRVAWEAARPPGVVTGDSWGRGVVAAAGRVRVGEVVVEVGSGRVVRHAASGSGPSRHRVEHTGDELVVVDTLTGEVTERSPLSVPSGAQLVARARSGGVTLLSDGEHSFRVEDGDWVADRYAAGRSVLVRDDGEVLTELGGTIADSDRAVGDPASFPVRRANGAVELVAAATGEVVDELTAPPGDLLVVDVVGDLALVATTSRQLPGPETGVPWMVDLVDARTGEVQRPLVMQSAEPPRLLGFLDDSTIVLSTRSGREVAVRGIDPDGRLGPIAQVTTGVPTVVDAPSAGGSALLATVGVSGGVAVGLDVRRGLLGFGRRGNVVWQADTPDAEVLAAGGGFVAAIPHTLAPRVVVVDAADGRVAATISRGDADLRVVNVPIAVLDGHVGMGRSRAFGNPQVELGATTWLDLHTGELTAMHDLFASHVGGEPEEVGADWTLHGVAPSAPGGHPVITRRRSRSVIQVLEPGEGAAGDAGFVTFEVPGQGDDGVAAYMAEVVGVGATRVAVWRRGFEDPTDMATYVLEPSSGMVVTVPDVVGVALLGDLLLAIEVDDTFELIALLGLDADSGQQLWRTEGTALVGTRRPPWTEDHRMDRELIVTATALGVDAVSLRDGHTRWSHASDVELSADHLVLGPRHVTTVATDGEVIALDRDDGTVAWRTSVGAPVASMTGAGEHTLVGTHEGLVVHLDGRGREVQRIAVGNDPVLGLAALGETVVTVVGDAVVGLRADGTGITRQDEVELP